jgi:hypothetical protein
MPKTNLHQQIFIDALPSKVWKVLTSCDYINQYFPGAIVHSQWTEGSSITAKAKREEGTATIHKGKVLQAIPGVMLKYELLEEPALNTTVITYEVIPASDGIELKFYSEGFVDAEDAYFLRMKETKLLLQKIKWLAEFA